MYKEIVEQTRVGLSIPDEDYTGSDFGDGRYFRIKATAWNLGMARDLEAEKAKVVSSMKVDTDLPSTRYLEYLSESMRSSISYNASNHLIRFRIPQHGAETLDIILQKPAVLAIYKKDGRVFGVVQSADTIPADAIRDLPHVDEVPTASADAITILDETVEVLGWGYYPPLFHTLEVKTDGTGTAAFSNGAAVFTTTTLPDPQFIDDNRLVIWIPEELRAIAKRNVGSSRAQLQAAWWENRIAAELRLTKLH